MPELPVFPSLVISADRLDARGSFAEAQAAYLRPQPELVGRLDALLRDKNIGVVAHFYMDPELQGVLTACRWPHIRISDSLLMADSAIEMADAGVRTIVVLGVDFMSENVRAMLDVNGHEEVPVYRVAEDPIGCSLAESAQARAYGAYLARAADTPRSLHVIYINTSLDVKAKSHHRVPTITCTSSNVVKTVLQAFAQVPDGSVWFGPDTYMGQNLRELFGALASMDDAQVAAVHPAHTAASVRALLPRFHHFEEGTCIVHHMFGREVVEKVRAHYADAWVAAHLEVPGEMFALGMEGQRRDAGVVGSTSNILGFIERKVDQAISRGGDAALRVVLGTEAGMITSIVRSVQAKLPAGSGVTVEIVFPVSGDAIAPTDDAELGVVPGVAGGEGCSTAGGCATCPYMKMNSLDALFDVATRVDAVPGATLAPYHPRKYVELVGGRTAAEVGGEPILHMRHFQRTGELSAELVRDITERHAQASATT